MKEFIGWLGAFSMLFAYGMLTIGLVNSTSIAYNSINLLGGVCLAYRVYQDKNYSNFALEIVFITIAIVSLCRTIFY